MATRRKQSSGGGFLADLGGNEELVMLGAIGLVAWVIHSGGIQAFFQSLTQAVGTAATNAGGAVINAAGQAAAGVFTGATNLLPGPTSDQTTDDPYVARWIIDNPAGGQIAASQWSTPSAYLNAQTIATGQGVPPPAFSAIAQTFPAYVQPVTVQDDLSDITPATQGY